VSALALVTAVSPESSLPELPVDKPFQLPRKAEEKQRTLSPSSAFDALEPI
jgi:hypothetical protein